jgi:hypothetical protein
VGKYEGGERKAESEKRKAESGNGERYESGKVLCESVKVEKYEGDASDQQPATSDQNPQIPPSHLPTFAPSHFHSFTPKSTLNQNYLRRVNHVSDLFELTEVFIEYVHLKWAISRGEHGGVVRSDRSDPPFEWVGMDFVSAEGVAEAIEYLDLL